MLGGEAEAIAERIEASVRAAASTSAARSAPRCSALAGPDRTLGADELEVAVLDRTDGRRAFRRIERRRARRRCSPQSVDGRRARRRDDPPATSRHGVRSTCAARRGHR